MRVQAGASKLVTLRWKISPFMCSIYKKNKNQSRVS